MKHSQGRAFHLLIMLLVSIAIGSAGLSWLLFNSSLFNNADTGPSTLQPISTLDSLRIPRLEDLQASPENPAAGRQDQAPVAETPSGPAPTSPCRKLGKRLRQTLTHPWQQRPSPHRMTGQWRQARIQTIPPLRQHPPPLNQKIR